VIREARETIEQSRRDMILACYANPNWDGKDNADKRTQYLKDVNDHFNKAISALYAPRDQAREVDVDWNNPFFAAHKREIERTKALFQAHIDGKTAGQAVDEELAAQNGRADIDQIPRNLS
jgi:hypothetical protein